MPCLILLSLLIPINLLHIEAAPTYVHNRCSSTGNFTPNSLYHTNLKHLLASLSSNATTHFFFNNTATATATATAAAAAVYGLFLCRGDVDESVCQSCVPAAAEEIVNKCPLQKEAIIWYEECMLRYSNRSFFGAMDEFPNDYVLEDSNAVDDPDRFNQIVADTLREAAEAAAAGGQGEKKFATEEANFSEFHTIYSLVECTPDLTSMDCSRCLATARAELPKCCGGEDRVTYLYPSCYLRYDKYQFYNQIVEPTPSPPPKEKSKTSTLKIVAIVVPTAVIAVLILIFSAYCFGIQRQNKKHNFVDEDNAVDVTSTESLQCDLATIEAATNNFSPSNKLGQGGFGVVYKGILSNGQEIAVKRLWRSPAATGADGFKNEAVLLAKLQHKNLVRLLGFCLAREEKLLVYEFVPNKSLDYFIFDPRKQGDLNWSTRHRIIAGIAKGILYLHEDSRLRIIHRDLKPENILLDADYEPKISDFGLARLFAVDQSCADTSRVVGTLGYMSPEYALRGRFSLNSDVYSFGIIILEIISGKRNTSFIQSQHGRKDFLSYVWKLWEDGTPWKLLDQTLLASYSENEVSRCVHIGLLCVQEDPEDRPNMATIVLMLNTSSITLPRPHKPVYYSGTKTNISESELMLHQSTSHEIPLFFPVTN